MTNRQYRVLLIIVALALALLWVKVQIEAEKQRDALPPSFNPIYDHSQITDTTVNEH